MNDLAIRHISTGLAFAVVCATATRVYAVESLPDVGIPQPCGVQLKTHNFTIDDLDRAHAMGFRVVRRGFYWTSVEKEKGVYDLLGNTTHRTCRC